VIAGVRSEAELLSWLERYRSGFRPSAWADRPYVVLAATVAVAATTEQARRLLLPEAWSSAYSRTRGVFPALLSVDEVLQLDMTEKELGIFEQSLSGRSTAHRLKWTPHWAAWCNAPQRTKYW